MIPALITLTDELKCVVDEVCQNAKQASYGRLYLGKSAHDRLMNEKLPATALAEIRRIQGDYFISNFRVELNKTIPEWAASIWVNGYPYTTINLDPAEPTDEFVS